MLVQIFSLYEFPKILHNSSPVEFTAGDKFTVKCVYNISSFRGSQHTPGY